MKQYLNTLTASLLALFIAGASPNTFAAEAELPSTENIINSLKPNRVDANLGRTRSMGKLRGVTLEGPTELPSLDMYITFNFGSAELTNKAKQELTKLGKALLSNELMAFSFQLSGHTDAVGSDEANMALSMKRAQSVKQHLVQTFGIEDTRMMTKGYGESQLALPSDPANGKNRRVQITNVGTK
ncbi:MAG: hypothetical protein COB59_06825 [Rhodospirillaceae bacterium]|nr:MAG: hypothetical protein COB59_06825 [Rhodospirillaceae bacterium]